jgi:hypothetical protein
MPSLITLRDNGHAAASCTARCYNATSPVCDCICNGLNHGVGLQAAIERTRREGAKAVAAYVADHPFAARWRLRFHLPPIPVHQPLLFEK